MATPLAAEVSQVPIAPRRQDKTDEDIVTRIQTNLDQLATQFYASVRYLATHHPLLDIDGTPLNEATGLPLRAADQQAQTPGAITTPGPSTNNAETDVTTQERKSKKEKKEKAFKDDGDGPEPAAKPPLSPDWTPMEPEPFDLDIQELADDLITKQRQIEDLIKLLPRQLEQEEIRQEERIRELVHELEDLEGGVEDARQQRDLLLSRIESVIEGIGRRGGGERRG